ncbi:MAG TPA: DNA polymerase III subunit alpha [Candidatus Saccharimonadales bacterium]|nr:DNA polymerase III subunit alpha [Candidatus Saccharimonadales bacterium]
MSEPPAGGQLASHFVHLHNHSHYSLLDGLQKIPEMLDQVKVLGMSAVALTDHGTLSGAIEFYNGAHERGLKPIIGMEAYVAPRGLESRSGKLDANPYHLILLATSTEGYLNLMRLSSMAHLEGFYYKPRLDRALISKYSSGLIALSGCASGEVAQHITDGDMAAARTTAEWYRDTFGADNYFLELQDHEHQWPLQKRINQGLRKLAAETSIPMVVTADSHYCKPEDREAHEILLCVQTGKTVDDADRMTMAMQLYLTDPKDITKRFAGDPEAILNTGRIAERCQVEINLGGIHIPKFPVPTEQTEREYLHQLSYQGLAWRYGGIPKEDIGRYTKAKTLDVVPKAMADRLDFELGVIAKMNYDGYFLIVADFINWGKNQGIIFGPGRGSAAGSIVSYALNITDIDPMRYDLLFERFLNPERISMPDIDVDMQDTRRQEVIDYVVEKYGEDRVAQIVTFGTMAARNAVRDTGRALGMPYGEVDIVAKLIPQPVQGRHIPLAVSVGLTPAKGDLKADPDLRKEYKSNQSTKRLIDAAIKLEGTIRSNGVHAAGVVIAPDEIVKFVPLQRAQKGGIVTQYEMHTIEDLGLLKMDFLGLSNLTIINNTLRIVRKVYGKSISTAEIPLDDKPTYALLSRGDTTGVFQLESAGMKRYLRDLKPNGFDDIIAMGALYRPGPLSAGLTDDYVARKNGRSQVSYDHPSMERALKGTYGVLVYQEQVMQIAQDFCGFSGGQADTLRKAIGKKQRDTMAKMEHDFVSGAVKTSGVTKDFAQAFWKKLEGFADYCFNKSHSACYALISYQTAYLKAHYPEAFMAALMTSDYGNIDRIAIEVNECKRMGLNVLAPDINESFLEFGITPNSNQIRFGLSAVKNVGMGAIEAILAAREQGPFSGIEDFAQRVSASEVNRKVWESLIKSGAMDGFGERTNLLHNLDAITSYATKAQKNALSGQIDIFGSMGADEAMPGIHMLEPEEAINLSEQLGWERELLGLYLSRHPLDGYEGFLAGQTTAIADLKPDMEGQSVTVGGIITTVRKITTKNGDTMAFVGLADKSGDSELIVFPKAYEANAVLWQTDQLVKVAGKISTKDRAGQATSEIKVMVDKARALNDKDAATKPPVDPTTDEAPMPQSQPAAAEVANQLTINLSSLTDPALLNQIKETLSANAGDCQAYIMVAGDTAKKIRLPFRVTISDQLLDKLKALLGQDAIAVA